MSKTKKCKKGKMFKKKIYSITLSESIVNKFNKKIGYASRSKAIEKLILNDLKNSSAHNKGPTREKRKSIYKKEVLQNV